MKVRKAIIPVAGLGTRFLPATKAQPKEMLTLVDKPVIQYIVEEAVAAGIEEIIFVTSQSKRAIEDHFDRNAELESRLREKQKLKELESVIRLSDIAKFAFVRQKEPKGNGHAIAQALPFIDAHEPVAILFGDDVIDGDVPCLKELIACYEERQAPVLAVMNVPREQTANYGVVSGTAVDARTWNMTGIVEKPKPEEAPTTLAVVGRYILTPDLFPLIGTTTPGKDGEIGITDAFAEYLKTKPMYAHAFTGKRYDCGNKTQFLIASVELGLKHPEVGAAFRAYLEMR
jgi:UTP--glucose-1-phosphate uridylyltransferase